MERSKVAFLARVKELLHSDKTGDPRWGQGAYYETNLRSRDVACVMGMLAYAELELWGQSPVEEYSGQSLDDLETDLEQVYLPEAQDVSVELAFTVCEQFSDRLREVSGAVAPFLVHRDHTRAHRVLTSFNDHPSTSLDDVRAVVEKTEARLYGVSI